MESEHPFPTARRCTRSFEAKLDSHNFVDRVIALTFPNTGYLYQPGLVSSSDGLVRPFDGKHWEKIIEKSGIKATDVILEIVPGTGNLSVLLLE